MYESLSHRLSINVCINEWMVVWDLAKTKGDSLLCIRPH